MGICRMSASGWCDDWNCIRYGCKKAVSTVATGSTGTANETLQKEEFLAGMRRVIDEAKTNEQWVVIDPQGRLYKGKVEELLPVMLPHHPLLAK